ncbi:peptidoglycan DD-metalloendopeptidase family protein [Clostridium algidicarnis]|uniref:peptidoglycan DD-metalloendopeptidase family protein n=1 Tax=Clostridium algidicarnis TaxID=37659 RepID=UPI00068C927C|nr:peptidoglycan DD-metalloendopeptidase family protein [Clostridium algidicarnis]
MKKRYISIIKTSIIISLFIIPLLVIYINSGYNLAYAAYVEGNCVAYYKDKEKVIDIYNKILDKNKDIKINEGIKFERIITKTSSLNNYDSIVSNIKASLDKEVDCLVLKIDEINLGILRDKDRCEDLFNLVKEHYIRVNDLNKEDIINTSINNNIYYIPYRAYESQIKTPEEIYKVIKELDSSKENPIMSVNIIGIKNDIEDIKEDTTIKSTDEYYMGEFKVQELGKQGKRRIEKQVNITNAKVISETMIKEEIIEAPKNKVILKGTKNPIGTTISFLERPSRGAITSNFGARWNNESHHGVDIAGNTGDPIGAALDGVVNKVGYDNIYGKYIKIDHGKGIETLYGHCSSISKGQGDTIKKGDAIGRVGSTGRSTGPHIHFELRLNGKAENPMTYMK